MVVMSEGRNVRLLPLRRFPSVAAWAICNACALGPWDILIKFSFLSHPPILFFILNIEKVEPRAALGCVF